MTTKEIREKQKRQMGLTEELHKDLRPYVEDHPTFGMMVRHPLAFSVPHCDEMNAWLNKFYIQKRDAVRQAWNDQDWSRYIALHERAYRWQALSNASGRMGDGEYWEQFGEVWMDSENIWQERKLVEQMLTAHRSNRRCMMSEEDRRALSDLPNILTVYRGHQECNADGLSWTLDRDKAAWFACRFKQAGILTTGSLSKRSAKALLLGRGESEIVCLPRNVQEKQSENL